MSAPQVYRAISAISRELSGQGIAKRHRNEREDYRYRSIDDVLNRLSPLLAKHKLCVLPRVLERTATDLVVSARYGVQITAQHNVHAVISEK